MGADHSHALSSSSFDQGLEHAARHDHALDLDLVADHFSTKELVRSGRRQTGNKQNDRLVGTAGSDILEGRAGADLLNGRAGNDLLRGGLGADVYLLSKGHDQIRGYGKHDSIMLSQELLDAGLTPADVSIKGFERNKRTWIELSYRLDGKSHSTLIRNPRRQVEIASDQALLNQCEPPVSRAASIVCDDVVPPGMIAAWEGSSAPSGWLLLRGGSFSRSQYPGLYQALGGTTTLPDYRNRFLVQYGYSSSAKAATTNGSTTAQIGQKLPYKTARPRQDFTFTTNSHSFRYGNKDKNGGGTSGSHGWRVDDATNTSFDTTASGSHTHRVTGGDSTTRPNAYAVNWIIKADQQSCSTVENILPNGIILATTASAPSGWGPVTALNGRYPVGSGSTYGLKGSFGYQTAQPSNAFTVDNPGSHTHKIGSDLNSGGGSGFVPIRNSNDSTHRNNVYTVNFNSHTHSFQAGGDSETMPDSVNVRWIKKTYSTMSNGYATALPSGVIAPWQTSASSIPSGWSVQSGWAGRYLRGSTSSLGSEMAYQTARPANSSFTLASDGAHAHKYGGAYPNVSGTGKNYDPKYPGNELQSSVHSHSHRISGGGDFTTRPDSVVVNFAKRTSSTQLDVCPGPASRGLRGSLTQSKGTVSYDASNQTQHELINPSVLDTAYRYDNNQAGTNRCADLKASSIYYSITGTKADDTIVGGSVNDTLIGGPGDDYLDGKAGNATLDGGAGRDQYVLAYKDLQTVTIMDWDGGLNDFYEDLILPSDDHYISRIEFMEGDDESSQVMIQVSGAGRDGVTGTTYLEGVTSSTDPDFPASLSNLILGTTGDDDFSAQAVIGGADGLFVGDHIDISDDVMVGRSGTDMLDGGGGDDTLYGGGGIDIFHLATDDHDSDDEYLIVMDFSTDEDNGRDVLYLEDGFEVKELKDVSLDASPTGESGALIHAGPIGTDTLAEGGITGRSFLHGVTVADLELGWDRDHVQNVIIGTHTHDDPEDQSLFGGTPSIVDGNEIKLFAGTDAAEMIFGREGDDQLEGNAGDDTLDGGKGADTLIGGAGEDVFMLRDDTAVVDAGEGDDRVDIHADAAVLGLDRIHLGSGRDRLVNHGALAVAGEIDLGPGNDRFETTTYLDADKIDGGKGENDQLILHAPEDESLQNQLSDFSSSGFAVEGFETIHQMGGSWAFDGALEGVDLVINGGSMLARLESRAQTAITMKTLEYSGGELLVDASEVVDDLRGRWRLIRTRRPIPNLDELLDSVVLKMDGVSQPLDHDDPVELECSPLSFALSHNKRGTAVFMNVSV